MKLFFVTLLLSACFLCGSSQRVYGNIQGLNGPLIGKLNEIALMFNSRVRVYSGCRSQPPVDPCHAQCAAADFSVDGVPDQTTYGVLRQNVQRFLRHVVIYHIPGRRQCSTGEHLHICNISPQTVFCFERTCNFQTECERMKNDTAPFEVGAGDLKIVDGFVIPQK